jgi:DMSO/TMAO reductase YedYZ molybdopterin-dependent catalytic subunit
LTRLFPVLHAGTVPAWDLGAWRFAVGGLVEKPVVLDWDAMMALPRRRVTTDIHCVTGWSKLDTVWDGVPTRAVWALVTPRPEVTHVMVQGVNDFSTNLALDDFLADNALFAFAFGGEPLPPEHGGSLRLVVPHLYFWKSAKWVTGLEAMAEDRPGYWEDRGYHMRGDPWKEERYW